MLCTTTSTSSSSSTTLVLLLCDMYLRLYLYYIRRSITDYINI